MIQLSAHHSELLQEIHNLSVDPAWSENSFNSLLVLPTVLCFAHDNLNCFILYSIIDDDAEILTLATHPDYRRQGLARILLNESFVYLRHCGVRTLFLEVDVSNTPAINLYKTLDFQLYGTRKNYYKNSDGLLSDALLMRKFF